MVKINELYELIDSAVKEKNDVFLCGTQIPDINDLTELSKNCKTAVVLPSKLYPSKNESICSCCTGHNRINSEAELIFFDISLIEDDLFVSELTRNRVGRIIIPFAEIADECEYGYSGKYAKIGELKQNSSEFIQIVALFRRKYDLNNFACIFAVDDCVVFDAEDRMPFRIIESNGQTDSFGLIFREICKKAGEKSLVYFPERSGAEDFSEYCSSRGEYVPMITGNSSCEEIRLHSAELMNGKCRAIAGTKSMLSVAMTVKADNAVVYGVPFSDDYFQRMLITANHGSVVFSKDDYVLSKHLTEEYCDKYVPVFNDSIRKEKLRRLKDAFNMICE